MTDIDNTGPFLLGDRPVNRMGYGAMQLAGPHVFGPPKDREMAINVLREAVEHGVNHIDTSDYYGPFVVNDIIREALYPYPENLVIVTKIGARRGDDASWLPANSPGELKSAVHDNLRRLSVDRIDVVNLRLMLGEGPTEGPIEEQIAAVADLQRDGLVGHIGISNATPEQVATARKLVDIVCVQNQFNLVHRNDDAMIDELRVANIAYVPFFPLGGFSPLQSANLTEVAVKLGATPLQVALSWLLQRSSNILLIPGTSSVKHLRENLAAAELHLDAETMAVLDSIGATQAA